MSAGLRRPLVLTTRAELQAELGRVRAAGGDVALVPTMGALHEGHASLLRVAREHAPREQHGAVVASVFVNPLQFAPGEDLDRYPRTFEADLVLCAEEGVDLVFAPSVEEVYPGGTDEASVAATTTVDPGPRAAVLEGRSRPTHFRGVLTVVAKLLGLVGPDVVVLGEKDYQQLVLVRAMVADLCLAVRVVGAPTHREPDGVARSSRNRYLDPEQRAAATALHRTLRAAVAEAAYGVDAMRAAARAELRASPGVDLDYLEITDPDLAPLPDDPVAGTPCRVLVAARVGTTRLIDNLPAVLGRPACEGSS